MKTIEQSTPLLPIIIASNIVAEARDLVLAHGLDLRVSQELAARAETHYQKTVDFRRRIRSASGREHLYAMMRHWLAGMLMKAGCPREDISVDWMNGQPMPQSETPNHTRP